MLGSVDLCSCRTAPRSAVYALWVLLSEDGKRTVQLRRFIVLGSLQCDILGLCRYRKPSVLDALKVVHDPDLHRDIVSLGFIKDLKIDGGRVAFTIELTTPACPVKDQMRDQARAAVMQLPGVVGVDVQMSARVREAVGADGARQPSPA